MEFIEPINVGGEFFNIKHNGVNTLELTHSDLTKTFKGTWSITLLGLDTKNTVLLSKNSLDEKIQFSVQNINHYLTAPSYNRTISVHSRELQKSKGSWCIIRPSSELRRYCLYFRYHDHCWRHQL